MSEERSNSLSVASNFKAFGLNISSCIHCPELLRSAGTPDVSVVYGDVPQDLPGSKNQGMRYQAIPGQFLLQVDGVARFLVRDGNEILIDRDPQASDDDVRLFLLGSAFGALLHQRGSLVLHGSTVKVDDGCVVILGRSGAGKSTLATVLRRRGYPCLGDDVCPITIGEDGVPYAAPAYPQAKLWLDSLQHIGIDEMGLRRVGLSLEKRAVPFEEGCDQQAVPVKRLYLLDSGLPRGGEVLRPIAGPQKIRLLRNHTYRIEFLQALGLAPRHFRQIADLASRLPLMRVIRPTTGFVAEEVAEAVESDFLSCV
jgi:hypothetical protein